MTVVHPETLSADFVVGVDGLVRTVVEVELALPQDGMAAQCDIAISPIVIDIDVIDGIVALHLLLEVLLYTAGIGIVEFLETDDIGIAGAQIGKDRVRTLGLRRDSVRARLGELAHIVAYYLQVGRLAESLLVREAYIAVYQEQ